MTTPATLAAPIPVTAAAKPSIPGVIATPLPTIKTQPVAVVVTQMPPDDHLTDWVNIGVSGSVGLVAAFVGAALGYLLTKKLNEDAKRRDEEEKFRFASYTLRTKLMKIYSNLNAIKENVEEAQAQAIQYAKNGFTPHVSLYLRSSLNSLTRITIDDEELFRAGRECPIELTNMVMMLDDYYNAKIDMVTRYSAERDTLNELFAGPIAADGTRTFAWDMEEYFKVQPKLFLLDQMVHGMMLRMEEERKSAHDAFVLLWKVTSGRFGLGKIYVDDLDGVRRTYEGDPKYTNKKSKIR